MTISMYTASVPVFKNMLGNLSHFLDKAQANAEARKFDPQVLVDCRLAPDMLPLKKQVQIACDACKNGAARIAGVEAPKFEDNEATLAELKERIRKTLDFLDSVPRSQLEGTDGKDITFPAGRDVTRTLKGEAYLLNVALPNLFFHVTTAYAILRHNGVELGKGDYLTGGRS
ncbi:DUF1993 family protein [Caenimonas terrae]|uniref:DUF1993 family protein n=1 Tax=Caenimonas terrae TaxID=696074 RepID=A0ABW0NH70_9BURK